MTEILPHSGTIKENIHYFPLRIYYEDTDVGGVVYYANYLKFMERARTEMLRVLGIDQKGMLDYNNPEDVSFVVKRAEIDFKKPARFDDSLIVRSEIIDRGGASIVIRQIITKNEEELVLGIIKIAAIGKDGKPKRLPMAIAERFE
ncbi:MAG: tol-pal system-associated acyl-CoA thioesterase [Alphaproteobacteria bacterium]|nr:tol-pal system-associated acyl-CoA thioesterase [Alphaproteobacteria bacterium]HPF46880.1 tol-pal system-associated acyl-CoA thioesterase [Emcibacteraceae bacterium]HRW29348.1 tol-pal system-associated acyl-CoA thioesterase [Emcibacteraceae bacterium]